MLSFNEVSFTYETLTKKQLKQGIQPRYALKSLSFTVNPGEWLGIAGHTGSGKSTLAKLTNGLLQPGKGQISYNGTNISDKTLASTICGTVGVIFQNPEQQLFAQTVHEDVIFGPKNLGLPEEEWDVRATEALALVGLEWETCKDISPFTLSGGQQRRVAIAGVLAMDPEILVFDEPTAGLDPQGQSDLLKTISGLHQKGKTIVMISHNMNDLANYAERILVLNQGEMAYLDTPEKVFSKENHLESIGLELPDAQKLATELQEEGFPLRKSYYTEETLLEELAEYLS